MTEITKIYLENEMDLILAHKRSMKLADFNGLSLSAQTSFGTAVSEVCRHVMVKNSSITVSLAIDHTKGRNIIIAQVLHTKKDIAVDDEALVYAGKLVDAVVISKLKNSYAVKLEQKTPARQKFSIEQVDEWRYFFRNEKPFSPYEEVRMKNIQLKELTEKLTQSERQYKALAESLPLSIVTFDEKGELVYANKWMQEFSGQGIDKINDSKWQSVIHEDDIASIKHRQEEQNNFEVLQSNAVNEYRVKNREGNYVWHLGSSVEVEDENNASKYWVGYLVDIQAQKLVEETLKDNAALKEAHEQLAHYQLALEERIQELNNSNFELEQFAYIASHDLQEPLRKLLVYNDYLQKKYAAQLDADALFVISKMNAACMRMRNLITDVLNFSKIRKTEIRFSQTDLTLVVKNVLEGLDQRIKAADAVITIGELPVIEASGLHVAQLFENILSNALKYKKENVRCEITISGEIIDGNALIHIRDNGIGFEDRYGEKIFGLFQRLHDKEEFEGTGIGLAICRKITDLHSGTVTAAGNPGVGAHFTVSLPIVQGAK